MVTYVNKKGERCTYPLASAMESSNAEMVKRLKYTKDLMAHMMASNSSYIDKAALDRDQSAAFKTQPARPGTTEDGDVAKLKELAAARPFTSNPGDQGPFRKE